MSKQFKRIAAIILSVALILSMLAMTAVSASALSYNGSASYKSGKYYRALTNVRLTGNQRTDIVNVAKSQVGYQEGSSSSQLSGEVRGNNNYTEYGRWYGMQDMWCAMFVSWCANTAGISSSTVPKHSYTPSGLSWFKSRGLAYSRATVASGGYRPQAGDIIYFKSSRNSNTTNHIGIVTGYSGSTVYTIEGNTSSATISTNGGAVAAKSYSISNTYIVYICKPNYSGTSNTSSSNTSNNNNSTNTSTNANSTAKALTFDAGYYSSKYPDLKNAFGADSAKLYDHFINYGIKEGRQAHPCFDVAYYLKNNADLIKAFGNDYTKAYNHYVTYGYKEYTRPTAECVNLGDDFKAKISYSSKNLSLSGNNVILYTPSSAPAQIWRFIRQSDGSYKIVNTKNNLCLDAAGGVDKAGTNVGIYEDNGTGAQRWFIYSKNGKYVLRAACARICVLDVAGASTADLTNIEEYTYNGTNAQMFSLTKVVEDLPAPTISNVAVSEITANGYKVTCTVDAPAGIKEVKFPTWTRSNDQDDIVWHIGTVSGNTASFYVNIKDHNNEYGEYLTHIYAYDTAGKYAKAETGATVPEPTVEISNVTVSDITAAGYKVTCTVNTPASIKEVKFPTWTQNNAQDDIIWYVATVSGNTASVYVNVKDHNYESGKYYTHIYAYDTAGRSAKAETEAIVPESTIEISDVKATEVTQNGYRITCTVNAGVGIKEVKFPTWTSNNGQDDLVWHVATVSGNTATCYISIKDHNNEAGKYITHIYAYDNAGKQVIEGIETEVPQNALSQMTAVNLGDNFLARINFTAANKNISLSNKNVITYKPSKKPAQVWRFVRNSDNSYRIVNQKTGESLDVDGAKDENGANIQIYAGNNSDAQKWFIYSVDGKYVLRPASSTERVLDITSGSTADSANVQLYEYNGSAAQKFTINKISNYISEVDPENLGDFTASINFVKANKNLSISSGNVIIYPRSSSDAQVWSFTRQTDGSYKIVNKKYNKCLEVTGAKNENGANVALYADNGTAAQRWFIYVKEGKYMLSPGCARTRVLDIDGGNTADLTNAQIWEFADCENQMFKFIPKTSTSTSTGTATDSQMAVMRKIIYAVETGGQVYGNVRYDDFTEAYTNSSAEHAITIGGGAWYANEAKRLLNRIRSTDPATFNSLDTAGIGTDLDTADWSTYKLSKTSAKAKCIQKIIGSPVGIKCQDQLLDEQMAAYMQEAKNLGVTDIAAQMMCANFRHQGGLTAVKRILAKTAQPYTLDNLYAACQTDTGNQVGAYKSRQKMVYNALKTYL